MYRTEGALALLALCVGLAHCFSWDIVVASNNQLEFYDNDGTPTHVEEDIPSEETTSLAYDPVHNRVLFVDYRSSSIYSFDIATRKTILFYQSLKFGYLRIAYDPVTQLLFCADSGTKYRILTLSKPGSTDVVEEKLLIELDESIFGFTVDSCRGYIYWGTGNKIERARFDGSEREVVIMLYKHVYSRDGIAIDQQKVYWLDNLQVRREYYVSIESADLNGANRSTLYTKRQGGGPAHGLLVSKDFIYWRTTDTFTQLTKKFWLPPHGMAVEPKRISLDIFTFHKGMAYKIENQTLAIQNCEPQKGPLPTNIDEGCEVSVCHNYCLKGDCSVSAEGQPKCRCNAGFSGERCEVTASSPSTIVTDAASNSTFIDRQDLNNTIKGRRIDDMDAMAKFTDDIKSTLRGWREEMEISIQSKLNDSIKYALIDMKQEMNSIRDNEDEKLKECVPTHDVSELKSSAQFQAAEPKELKERVDTIPRHSSEQSQTLVSNPEQKIDSLSKQSTSPKDTVKSS